MQEKRAYHRFKVNLFMSYLVPPRRERVPAAILDVGGTGLCFETKDELKNRQELLMYISLGGLNPIEMHAKVVNVVKVPGQTGFRVGVRIADKMKFDERQYVKYYAGQLGSKA